MRQASFAIITMLILNACALPGSYVKQYRNHPGARVDCSKYLTQSVESNSQGAVQGDTNLQGSVTSQAERLALRDKKGDIYSACLDNWALVQASNKADRINECILPLAVMVIFIPLIPICYAK